MHQEKNHYGFNVIKLKNRSVWDITVDNKDSWGWKCILNLRDGWKTYEI